MRSEKLKRFCAMLLSVLMLFTMMPSLALADDPDSVPVKYAITVDTGITHGTVTVTPAQTEAEEGDTVKFTAVPEEGYERASVTVKAGEEPVDVSGPEEGTDKFSFKMPASAVTITAVFTAIEYDVVVEQPENGNVMADKVKACKGDTVKFTAVPSKSYARKSVTVKAGEEPVDVSGPEEGTDKFSFKMPASAVTITAEFVLESTIEVKKAEHGSVTAEKEKACTGDLVTFTAVPEEGYERVSVTVNDGDVSVTDVGSDKFSFVMPASAVTITAVFTAIKSNVEVKEAEHGSVTADRKTAFTGDKVYITVQPDNYYKLKSLRYVVKGKAPVEITEHTGDKYEFPMPGADVEVVPEFTDIIYKISADPDMKNGSVTFTDDGENPVEGAKHFGRVNVNVDPDSGYLLETIHAEGGGRRYDDIISKSSVRYYINQMPDVDLIVYATFKTHTHKLVHTAAAAPSCETSGNIEYWYCEECNSYFTDAEAANKIRRADIILPAIGGHSWGAWIVTKQPTATKAGEKKRVCKHDSSHVEIEKIPATGKKETPTPTPEKPKKSSKKAVLVARAKTGINQVTLSWNKIKGADRYVILFSKCNDNENTYKVKKIKTVKANVLKYTVNNLEKGRCYKYMIIAQKKKGGKYKKIAKTVLSHTIIGNESWTETVPKSLKLNKKAVTLKIGKTVKLKGKINLYNSEKAIMSHAPALRFASTDPSVATVSTNGKIKAKKKGTCTIYAQTINGISRKCKVTVK